MKWARNLLEETSVRENREGARRGWESLASERNTGRPLSEGERKGTKAGWDLLRLPCSLRKDQHGCQGVPKPESPSEDATPPAIGLPSYPCHTPSLAGTRIPAVGGEWCILMAATEILSCVSVYKLSPISMLGLWQWHLLSGDTSYLVRTVTNWREV